MASAEMKAIRDELALRTNFETDDDSKPGNWLVAAIQKFGQPLEAIVVPEDAHFGNVLFGNDATEWLNANYCLDRDSSGPIYAYTSHRVFFIVRRAGSTSLEWVPRHPAALVPKANLSDAK